MALGADGPTLAECGGNGLAHTRGDPGSIETGCVRNSGAVYVYQWTCADALDCAWQASGYVKAINPGVGDYFGNMIALSGCENDGGAGSAIGNSCNENKTVSDCKINSGTVYTY